MKLLTKLAGMVTILLAITFFVAGFGMVSIANVGENLRGIANSDVPLLNSITRITMNQLEQSVWFERATMALEKNDLYAYEKAEEELMNTGYQAKNEFEVSMQLLKTSMDEMSDSSDAAKYSDVAERLNEISREYYDLNDSTQEILLHMKNGTISLTDIDMSLVKDQVQSLSDKLRGLTAEISGSTQAMAVITKQQEADRVRDEAGQQQREADQQQQRPLEQFHGRANRGDRVSDNQHRAVLEGRVEVVESEHGAVVNEQLLSSAHWLFPSGGRFAGFLASHQEACQESHSQVPLSSHGCAIISQPFRMKTRTDGQSPTGIDQPDEVKRWTTC